MKVAMPQQHSQVSCVGVGQNVNTVKWFYVCQETEEMSSGHRAFFFPPNGLVFLNVICKILREEFLLLRAC